MAPCLEGVHAMSRWLWLFLGLFCLGELVAFAWWLLPDDLHVVPVLAGLAGLLFLGAAFLAPDRGVVGTPADVPFEGSPSLSVERQPTAPDPVHVYRNRVDDRRGPDLMYFCPACNGWYGVPHTGSHCRNGDSARWRPQDCACRFCKAATGQPIQGRHGFFTAAPEWQPPLTVDTLSEPLTDDEWRRFAEALGFDAGEDAASLRTALTDEGDE